MRLKYLGILAVLLTIFSAVTVLAQDIQIRFPKGRTSATMTGRVVNGGRVCYFAKARAGQTFAATLSSKSGKVQIFESGDTSYNYTIEQGGDQSVCVDNLSRATTCTLTVSIR